MFEVVKLRRKSLSKFELQIKKVFHENTTKIIKMILAFGCQKKGEEMIRGAYS